MSMLSKLQVAQLARDCGLSRWADDLVSTVSVGWELSPIDTKQLAPGASKIGGLPDLAPGEEWPFNGRGIPMTLMAQLDLSRLEPPTQDWTLDDASWSVPRGLMRIFADLVDSPIDVCPAIVLVCPPDAALRAAALPVLPDPWPPGGPTDWFDPEERYRILPEIAVNLSPFLSAPEIYRGIRSDVWDTSPGAPENYQRWLDQLRVGERGVEVTHAVVGHPRSLHEDIRAAGSLNFEASAAVDNAEDLAQEDAWRPLLSLFDDDAYDLKIADGGAFFVLAPARDLLDRRYDRLICVPETA